MLAGKILGLAQRELIDKRIFFKKSEVVDLKEGENDDIYMWTTCCPDSIYPRNKQYVRAETLVGLARIGRH